MVKGGQMTGPTAAENGEWFSLTEAAPALGLQREALRSQVRRKRFLTARANDNSLRIFIRQIDRARLAPTTNPVSDQANDRPVVDAEIAELRAEIVGLRGRLEAATTERDRLLGLVADRDRAIAGILDRVMALEEARAERQRGP
jgi:hypothetical protein